MNTYVNNRTKIKESQQNSLFNIFLNYNIKTNKSTKGSTHHFQ